MSRFVPKLLLLALAVTPGIYAVSQGQQPKPLAEQVYKDVEVFKGVPASDMIPAMEFMSASMNYTCADCHDTKDYAADNKNKDVTRKMILMQREINERHFDGRLEVTCMSCHNKEEHPVAMPLPDGVNRRHPMVTPAPKPQDLVAKHVAAVGPATGVLVRTGTLTAPNEETSEMETLPLEIIQAPGGKFRFVSGNKKVTSDGRAMAYNGFPITDEPAAIFGRVVRAWRGDEDLKGLARLAVTGKEKVGAADTVVVQGFRAATESAEELYFDTKTGLVTRMVNFRRSTVGTAVSSFDYSNFKKSGDLMLPMKIVIKFPGTESWTMEFKTAKIDPTVKDDVFKVGK